MPRAAVKVGRVVAVEKNLFNEVRTESYSQLLAVVRMGISNGRTIRDPRTSATAGAM